MKYITSSFFCFDSLPSLCCQVQVGVNGDYPLITPSHNPRRQTSLQQCMSSSLLLSQVSTLMKTGIEVRCESNE